MTAEAAEAAGTPRVVPRPWPRAALNCVVYKAYDPDGHFRNRWFVSSRSQQEGAFWLVQWHGGAEGNYWTCSCPGGHNAYRKMGTRWERACAHVRAVSAADADDGYPPLSAGELDPEAFV